MKNPHMELWILEDDEFFRQMLVEGAKFATLKTTELTCLTQAWQHLKNMNLPEEAPLFVLSDFKLPEGDSREWLQAVKLVHPEVTRICMSGGRDEAIFFELMVNGISFVEKPFNAPALFAAMKKLAVVGRC